MTIQFQAFSDSLVFYYFCTLVCSLFETIIVKEITFPVQFLKMVSHKLNFGFPRFFLGSTVSYHEDIQKFPNWMKGIPNENSGHQKE